MNGIIPNRLVADSIRASPEPTGGTLDLGEPVLAGSPRAGSLPIHPSGRKELLPDKYLDLKEAIISAGYEEEITWAETVKPPESPLTFFLEYAWVVINSGMKNQVARTIWLRVHGALLKGRHISTVFKHPGKSNAIQTAWENQEKLFNEYLAQPAEGKLAWLEQLPWIGPVTKFHLGKNLGMDFCKPDRHLVRIAGRYGKTPEELCSALAQDTGDRIGTVDLVIWRAANLGMI